MLSETDKRDLESKGFKFSDAETAGFINVSVPLYTKRVQHVNKGVLFSTSYIEDIMVSRVVCLRKDDLTDMENFKATLKQALQPVDYAFVSLRMAGFEAWPGERRCAVTVRVLCGKIRGLIAGGPGLALEHLKPGYRNFILEPWQVEKLLATYETQEKLEGYFKDKEDKLFDFSQLVPGGGKTLDPVKKVITFENPVFQP